MRSFVRSVRRWRRERQGAVAVIGSGTAGAEPVSQEFASMVRRRSLVPAGVCSLSVDMSVPRAATARSEPTSRSWR